MRRSMVMGGLVVSAALAVSTVGVATSASPVGSRSNPVKATTSTSTGFAPRTVKVTPGARVYFTNVDKARHNAVEDRVTGSPRFRSGAPTTGNFSVKAPRAVGRYSYICAVHAFMRGTLVVRK